MRAPTRKKGVGRGIGQENTSQIAVVAKYRSAWLVNVASLDGAFCWAQTLSCVRPPGFGYLSRRVESIDGFRKGICSFPDRPMSRPVMRMFVSTYAACATRRQKAVQCRSAPGK